MNDNHGQKRKLKRQRRDERDSETSRTLGRVSSRLNIKPISRRGGGKIPKFIVHHNFHYAPEPKDRVPVVKPSSSSSEPWTEPTHYKPQSVRVEPDAEKLLKVLEKNPELYDKLSDKLLERMNKDFEKQEEATVESSPKQLEKGYKDFNSDELEEMSERDYENLMRELNEMSSDADRDKAESKVDAEEIAEETAKDFVERSVESYQSEAKEGQEVTEYFERFLELQADTLTDYLEAENPSVEKPVDIELNLDQMEDTEPTIEPLEPEFDIPELQELENELVEPVDEAEPEEYGY